MFLSVEGVNKIYNTGKIKFQALYDINLQIDKGEFTAICGPSGSGKTTLLNIIGCIDSADSGEVVMNKKNILFPDENKRAKIRREIYGFIFQTYNLIPVLSVYENVELPLRLLNKYNQDQIKQDVMDVLKRVGLEELYKRFPYELSGGQQQRVSIARALVKKPQIVLADEPTANLDSTTGEAIVDLMQKMNREDGITFLFSTHDSLIMKHAKRIVKMRDGKICEDERNPK